MLEENLQNLALKPEIIQPDFLYSVFVILCILLLIFFWVRHQKILPQAGKLKILEQKQTNSKTRVYLIDCEGEQFLLADNHQALSWHALKLRDGLYEKC